MGLSVQHCRWYVLLGSKEKPRPGRDPTLYNGMHNKTICYAQVKRLKKTIKTHFRTQYEDVIKTEFSQKSDVHQKILI